MIYADYNATAPMRPEAREAMLAALDLGAANPSSVHKAGRAARAVVERARAQIGGAIGSRAEDILFTSGGTESLALAIQGAVRALDGKATLIVSAIEHEAATKAAGFAGVPVETAYVLATGQVDLDDLKARLGGLGHGPQRHPHPRADAGQQRDGNPAARGRSGRDRARRPGGLTVCDAVQGLGKVQVNAALLGADFIALSAHKIGGPQGVGALWHRAGAPLKALLHGGGQERGLRSGTENVAGIAGFGAAAEAAVRDLPKYAALAKHRDTMEARLKAEGGVTVIGEGSAASGGHVKFRPAGFPRRDAGDGDGPGRRLRLGGLGLLVRKGEEIACADGDGRR